jgi:hypothetical protein
MWCTSLAQLLILPRDACAPGPALRSTRRAPCITELPTMHSIVRAVLHRSATLPVLRHDTIALNSLTLVFLYGILANN